MQAVVNEELAPFTVIRLKDRRYSYDDLIENSIFTNTTSSASSMTHREPQLVSFVDAYFTEIQKKRTVSRAYFSSLTKDQQKIFEKNYIVDENKEDDICSSLEYAIIINADKYCDIEHLVRSVDSQNPVLCKQSELSEMALESQLMSNCLDSAASLYKNFNKNAQCFRLYFNIASNESGENPAEKPEYSLDVEMDLHVLRLSKTVPKVIGELKPSYEKAKNDSKGPDRVKLAFTALHTWNCLSFYQKQIDETANEVIIPAFYCEGSLIELFFFFKQKHESAQFQFLRIKTYDTKLAADRVMLNVLMLNILDYNDGVDFRPESAEKLKERLDKKIDNVISLSKAPSVKKLKRSRESSAIKSNLSMSSFISNGDKDLLDQAKLFIDAPEDPANLESGEMSRICQVPRYIAYGHDMLNKCTKIIVKKIRTNSFEHNLLKRFNADEMRTISDNRVIPVLRFLQSFDDEYCLVVMPCGENVLSYLKAYPLKTPSIKNQLRVACDFLHSQKIVHNDIKPDNCVVINGRLFLIDFGLSKENEIVEREGIHGTEGFFPKDLKIPYNIYAKEEFSINATLELFDATGGMMWFRNED